MALHTYVGRYFWPYKPTLGATVCIVFIIDHVGRHFWLYKCTLDANVFITVDQVRRHSLPHKSTLGAMFLYRHNPAVLDLTQQKAHMLVLLLVGDLTNIPICTFVKKGDAALGSKTSARTILDDTFDIAYPRWAPVL